MSKLSEIFAEAGVAGIANRGAAYVYRNCVRPFLPTAGHLQYSGVRVARKRKPLDQHLPSIYSLHRDDLGNYEGTLVAAIAEYVQPGDKVVVVGGGLGVTVVSAARAAGPSGSVLCFEGAAECVRNIKQAIRLNDVRGAVTIQHAVVAKSISVYGKEPEGPVVAPTELPDCDVLELDCEGAELDILSQMTIRPRAVLVETHGMHGAPTEVIARLLESLGYAVSFKGSAEQSQAEYCKQHDIQVLAASLPSTRLRLENGSILQAHQ